MYTKSVPQPTDSSTTSRVWNVEDTATAETNVEDHTTVTILGDLLSDAEMQLHTRRTISQLETLS